MRTIHCYTLLHHTRLTHAYYHTLTRHLHLPPVTRLVHFLPTYTPWHATTPPLRWHLRALHVWFRLTAFRSPQHWRTLVHAHSIPTAALHARAFRCTHRTALLRCRVCCCWTLDGRALLLMLYIFYHAAAVWFGLVWFGLRCYFAFRRTRHGMVCISRTCRNVFVPAHITRYAQVCAFGLNVATAFACLPLHLLPARGSHRGVYPAHYHHTTLPFTIRTALAPFLLLPPPRGTHVHTRYGTWFAGVRRASRRYHALRARTLAPHLPLQAAFVYAPTQRAYLLPPATAVAVVPFTARSPPPCPTPHRAPGCPPPFRPAHITCYPLCRPSYRVTPLPRALRTHRLPTHIVTFADGWAFGWRYTAHLPYRATCRTHTPSPHPPLHTCPHRYVVVLVGPFCHSMAVLFCRRSGTIVLVTFALVTCTRTTHSSRLSYLLLHDAPLPLLGWDRFTTHRAPVLRCHGRLDVQLYRARSPTTLHPTTHAPTPPALLPVPGAFTTMPRLRYTYRLPDYSIPV